MWTEQEKLILARGTSRGTDVVIEVEEGNLAIYAYYGEAPSLSTKSTWKVMDTDQ